MYFIPYEGEDFMKIAIAGGTGFVGSKLANKLISDHHAVYILTRNKEKASTTPHLHYVPWLTKGTTPEIELDGVDAIINLAGTSIQNRWTAKNKRAIFDSRVAATKSIVHMIQKMKMPPKVLLNGSAVGYYGTSETAVFTEDSPSQGDDFLAKTVKQWEHEAKKAEEYGVRTVFTRFGIVLGSDGGAFPMMKMPYKMGVGGTIGTGEQWVSWVHIEDVVNILQFCINENISGPVNVTSPQPVQMKTFGMELGTSLNRPHWLKVPSPAIKCVLGEMSMLVLEGQKALPKKLEEHGYEFSHKEIREAFNTLKER